MLKLRKHSTNPAENAFIKHRRSLLRHASRAVGRDDAEDIVQETAIRMFISWNKRNPDSPVLAWLYRIQNCVIADFCRRESKRGTDEGIRELILEALDRHADVLDVENRDEIERLMSCLDPVDAGILFMHDYEGLSLTEIAVLTGRTIDQVKYAHVRAKDNARKLLIK